jgi:hypothetical protein
MKIAIWKNLQKRRIVGTQEDHDERTRVCITSMPGHTFGGGTGASHFAYIEHDDTMGWANSLIDSQEHCALGAACPECKEIEAERPEGLRKMREHIAALERMQVLRQQAKAARKAQRRR